MERSQLIRQILPTFYKFLPLRLHRNQETPFPGACKVQSCNSKTVFWVSKSVCDRNLRALVVPAGSSLCGTTCFWLSHSRTASDRLDRQAAATFDHQCADHPQDCCADRPAIGVTQHLALPVRRAVL